MLDGDFFTVHDDCNDIESQLMGEVFLLDIEVGCFDDMLLFGSGHRQGWITRIAVLSRFYLHKTNEPIFLGYDVDFQTAGTPIFFQDAVTLLGQMRTC